MDDVKIIEMYFDRNETAIKETQDKYGNFCYGLAYRILLNSEDAKECENDTYLRVWNTIPPKKPTVLISYLSMITRSLALDRFRKNHAQKRNLNLTISLGELEECIPDNSSVYEELEADELAMIISSFLHSLPQLECDIFLQRYWYFLSIKEISECHGFGQSKVKMMLLRVRNKLFELLKKEGVLE